MTLARQAGDEPVRFINPYAAADEYRNRGWRGSIPLPYREKHPPPTGFIGHNAPHPTDERVQKWIRGEDLFGDKHNIGIRLAGVDADDADDAGHEIIGIDVDHYTSGDKDKRGFDQLQELTKTLGPLPDTWISSSRTDGKSGIRFYRVPAGFAYRGKVDKDIEVISKGNRFAVVWPSVHPEGTTYWWFPPGVAPDKPGRDIWKCEIPCAATLPDLPEAWHKYLTQGGMRADSKVRIDMDSSRDEIYAWADETFHGDDESPMCTRMAKSVKQQIEDIANEATSHDKIVKAHWHIYQLASEGHLGWNAAVNEIEAFYVEDTLKREKRDLSEVKSEVFRSRINGLRKIKAQIDERIKIGAVAIDPQCTESGICATVGHDDESLPATVCLADIEPKRVEWLWRHWLPLGKVAILEGEPEIGKSTITLSWASIVSTGAQWPETVTTDGETVMSPKRDPAGVLLIGSEDGNEDTVIPRLMAAGADRNRVFNLSLKTDDNGNVIPLTIPHDIDMIRRAILEKNIRLIVIDPITAYLPEKANTDKDSSIRKNLDPLARLADETGATIVLIRHFTKASGASAKTRGGGSVAYTALARSVICAVALNEPDGQGTHALGLTKGNLAKKVKSVTYRIDSVPTVFSDDEDGVPRVIYCSTSDLTADQLVGADSAKPDARKSSPMRDDAEEALREILADGEPHEMNPTIARAMDLAGCKEATVRNAAKNIGILKDREYENGKIKCWTWQLPPVVIPRVLGGT